MEKEMLNISGNLINDVEIKTIQGKDGEVTVANFTLFRKMGKDGEKRRSISTVMSMEKRRRLQRTLKREISSMFTDITKRFKKRVRHTETLL